MNLIIPIDCCLLGSYEGCPITSKGKPNLKAIITDVKHDHAIMKYILIAQRSCICCDLRMANVHSFSCKSRIILCIDTIFAIDKIVAMMNI